MKPFFSPGLYNLEMVQAAQRAAVDASHEVGTTRLKATSVDRGEGFIPFFTPFFGLGLVPPSWLASATARCAA